VLHQERIFPRQEPEGELTRERSLSIQAVALALGSSAAQVLVAVIYIFTARAMQPDDFGVVATAMALGAVGAALLDFGANSYWVRELASGRLTQEQLNPRMATRLSVAMAAAGIVIAAAVVTDTRFIATGVLLLSTTAVTIMLVPLRAARRAEFVGVLTVIDRAVAIVAFFMLLAVGVDAGHALWIGIALGDVILVGLVGFFERSTIRLRPRRFSNPWTGAKWFSLTTLSISAQQMDLPIMTAFAGPAAAGIYGGVSRWIQPMILATGSFTAAVAPFLAAQPDLRGARPQLLRASWILAITILISIGVLLAAPWLVTNLLGDEYAGATPVLRWLAAAMILNTVAQPMIAALLARQLDHIAAVIMLASVLMQLATVAALAPALGAVSAGIGMFVAQAVQIAASATFAVVLLRRRRHSTGKRSNGPA